jgi:FtsZ-binding cell division protein ZapB
LHDFMDSSKELEKEMDREISAAQSKVNELQVKSEKLKGDVDEWKVCAYIRET